MNGEGTSGLRDKARLVFGPAFSDQNNNQDASYGAVLPRFLLDFLAGQYGPAAEELIIDHFPTARTRQLMRHRLLQDGELVLLDYVEVRADLERGEQVARLAALEENRAGILPGLLDTYPDLLQGGLWGRATVVYDHEAARRRGEGPPPVTITAFQPLQATVDLSRFVAARAEFTTSEWVELLMRSAGYRPVRDRRLAFLYLVRLLPLVERNFNLLELGPKNTGKTFLLRNLSPRAFTLAGGRATPANLFVNLVTGAMGLVGSRQVVIFDEVSHASFTDDLGTVALLKDFMESGQFSRGRSSHSSEASLVFLGNIRVEGRAPAPTHAHLFEPLPSELQDTAFLDRLHAFLPGWELPKLTPGAVNPGWGLSTDYFGEILLALRDLAYGHTWLSILERYPPRAEMTRRDHTAVEKVARGLCKLIFPHGRTTEPELRQILALAGELRQRVENQLEIMDPGEFSAHEVGFALPGAPPIPADFAVRCQIGALDRRANLAPAPGEVTSLSLRSVKSPSIGGMVHIVQASAIEGGTGLLKLTGAHDTSLEQALHAAFHYLQKHLPELGVSPDCLRNRNMVVHLVALGRGREGADMGLAFVLAMVSALLSRPLVPALAVTGEVSLHGDIRPVDALAQKLLAAYRHGRRLVLVPRENERDAAPGAVPERVLAGLTVVGVGTVREALERGFGFPGGETSGG